MSMVIVGPSRGVTICNVRLPLSSPPTLPVQRSLDCVQENVACLHYQPGAAVSWSTTTTTTTSQVQWADSSELIALI